jgi:hypothetical protein
MTQSQKIVKYLGIALAIVLLIGIVGAALRLVLLLGGLTTLGNTPATGDVQTWTFDETVTGLFIDVSALELTVKEGDTFSVETNGQFVACKRVGNTVTVKETRRLLWRSTQTGQVTVTLPEELLLDKADIATGAGAVTLGSLAADTLELELGAGEVTLRELDITRRTDIDGGAGKITVSDSRLSNLDLDMGIGELVLSAAIHGDSEIDFGIGSADLTLIGTAEEYRLRASKGIGAVTLGGEKMTGDTFYGNGANRLELNGGIGEIAVRYADAA